MVHRDLGRSLCFVIASCSRTDLTGTLIGTVKDEQGAAIPGGQVRITSSALIGGPRIMFTSEVGQFRFTNLGPGSYTLDIETPGFASLHEEDIRINASATLREQLS